MTTLHQAASRLIALAAAASITLTLLATLLSIAEPQRSQLISLQQEVATPTQVAEAAASTTVARR